MCGCEPGFTCSRCADTPHDPRYEDAEPRDPWQDYPHGHPLPDENFEPEPPYAA